MFVLTLHRFSKNTAHAEDLRLLCTKLQKMTETLIITVLIIAIAVIFMAVKVILRKNGSFASQHIHDSKAMKQRGINCVMEQDREMRKKNYKAINEKSR